MQAQGGAGLMRFLELELDSALALDPQAQDKGRLTRLIAGYGDAAALAVAERLDDEVLALLRRAG